MLGNSLPVPNDFSEELVMFAKKSKEVMDKKPKPPSEFVVLTHSLRTLRTAFLWPREGYAFNPSKRFFYLFLISALGYIPFAVGSFGHIIINIKRHVAEFIVEDISLSSSLVGTLYLVLLFRRRQPKLAILYRDLSDFSEFGIPDNFESTNKRLNLLSDAYSLYCGVGGIIYGIASMLQAPACQKLNKEKDLDELCGYFAPVYFPFEVDYFPVKHIIIFFQFYTCFTLLRTSSCVTFTTYEIAQHIILRIRHMRRIMKEIFEIEDYEEKKKKMIFCFKYHIHIIGLFDQFDACYQGPTGVHITLTGVILGCISNQLINKLEIGPIIHVVGWTTSLYVVCNAGQTIMTESALIAETTYFVDWHRMPPDLQNDMKLMLLLAQREFCLHASFQTLSLELFVDILKKAYSYMTLLNQTTASKEGA